MLGWPSHSPTPLYSFPAFSLQLAAEEASWEAEQAQILREAEAAKNALDAEPMDWDVVPASDMTRAVAAYRARRQEVARRRRSAVVRGDVWREDVDAVTGQPCFVDTRTGRAQWEKPRALHRQEALQLARAHGWSHVPDAALRTVYGMLAPRDGRMAAMATCRRWGTRRLRESLYLRVRPPPGGVAAVDAGAVVRDVDVWTPSRPRQVPPPGYVPLSSEQGGEEAAQARRYVRAGALRGPDGTFTSLRHAIAAALPGDTVEVAAGRYFEAQPPVLRGPLRIVADGDVVLRVRGTLHVVGRVDMEVRCPPFAPVGHAVFCAFLRVARRASLFATWRTRSHTA